LQWANLPYSVPQPSPMTMSITIHRPSFPIPSQTEPRLLTLLSTTEPTQLPLEHRLTFEGSAIVTLLLPMDNTLLPNRGATPILALKEQHLKFVLHPPRSDLLQTKKQQAFRSIGPQTIGALYHLASLLPTANTTLEEQISRELITPTQSLKDRDLLDSGP